MPLGTQMPFLYLLNDEVRGRGVYTSEDIAEGSLIEICPVIILSAKDTSIIHATHLHDYYFSWDLDKKTSAIALGYGSLYNHSKQNNADFEIYPGEDVIRIIAVRDIRAKEEITLDYLGLKEDGNVLWFEEK